MSASILFSLILSSISLLLPPNTPKELNDQKLLIDRIHQHGISSQPGTRPLRCLRGCQTNWSSTAIHQVINLSSKVADYDMPAVTGPISVACSRYEVPIKLPSKHGVPLCSPSTSKAPTILLHPHCPQRNTSRHDGSPQTNSREAHCSRQTDPCQSPSHPLRPHAYDASTATSEFAESSLTLFDVFINAIFTEEERAVSIRKQSLTAAVDPIQILQPAMSRGVSQSQPRQPEHQHPTSQNRKAM